MVNRKNTTIARDADKRHEHESSTQLLSALSSPKRERSISDDLIGSLAGAYENERARQVSEWERVGFQSIYRA
jgi:hypothetical protein